MTSLTAHQMLTIFTWFLIAILLAILLLIARFYENVSKERTYFWAFGAPILIFAAASVRYAFNNQVGGDPVSDLLWFVGGLMLIGMCLYLYNLMTRGR
jgi:hypothetical protein